MKIFANNFVVGNVKQVDKTNFGDRLLSPQRQTKQIDELPNTQAPQQVRVPIAYNHIQDIKLSDSITAKYYKLANGQKVVIVPKEGTTVVKSYVNTGAFNEPDNVRGISHYIEHNLFNGSEDLGDKVFFEEVEKLGASTNASTSFAVTDYFISSQLLEDTDLEQEIKLHAGMLQSPKFLTDKLEKEKKIVDSEINMYSGDNESLGYTQTIKNLFNIKSSSLDLIAGTTDNIDRLTRDDVVEYFEKNYSPANTVTVITGDVDADKTMELVSKYFNSNKTQQGTRKFEVMTPTDKPVRQDLISKKSESNATSVFLAFAGPKNNDVKDNMLINATMQLLTGIYSSRLQKLEEKYATGIHFNKEKLSSNPNDRNMLMIEAKIPDSKSEDFLKDLYKVINEASTQPLNDVEFSAIKNRMKKAHSDTLESSFAINSRIGNALLNNELGYITDYEKIVNEMTPNNILNTAKKYFDLNKSALTLVHPSNTTEETIKNNYNKSTTQATQVAFTGSLNRIPLKLDNLERYITANNFEVVFNNTDTDKINYTLELRQKDWTSRQACIVDVLGDIFDNAGIIGTTQAERLVTLDKYGITSMDNVDAYGIGYSFDCPKESFDKAIEFNNQGIFNINLTQEELNKTISRLRDRYLNHEKSPVDPLKQNIFQGTSMQFTINDKLKSLDTITLDDVKNFYNDILANSQGRVVVSGPFKKEPELKTKVFSSLSPYQTRAPKTTELEKNYKPTTKTEVYTTPTKRNQADIIMAYKFKQNGNIKDSVCINLLNSILGESTNSRLFTDLREKRHLAYHVSSSIDTLGDMGTCALTIGTTTENVETGEKTFDNIQKSIDGFRENIEKIKTEKVTKEELNNAKKALKTALLNATENNDIKNMVIMGNMNNPYGLNYVNDKFKLIDSITVEDIYNTANNVFSGKPVYSIAGTQASLDANKEYFETLKIQ